MKVGLQCTFYQHIEAETKWPTCPRRHFQMNENVSIAIQISLKFVPTDQYSSIGSDNGLAPSRRQAIIWTNDG